MHRFPFQIHRAFSLMLAGTLFSGCSMYSVERQWNSSSQILMSEASQVKLRAQQTQVFDTTDRDAVMQAVVATLQDLDFTLEVADPELGVFSASKLHRDGNDRYMDIYYTMYDGDELLMFARNYRSWGPFQHRRDLVRLTVTVRPKSASQLMVRASVQYDLRAVEDPSVYQVFFKSLRQAMFLSSNQ
ncbi:hypothetical protein [Nitrospina gracilis]|uniref:hypothetical protein n=1 Tax=Nitrospina gracilis TaxID=35801 RepID=UPI001F3A440E|nr:hypothetical protein [Nitrospina gracilis]MCF8721828.1 hypothetical protein [Nitrospina gracilis Nb-211]